MDRLVAVVSRVPRKLRYDDDAVDRLSHRYTVVILVVFAMVSMMQQYVGRPITCWVPKEFTGSHTKFANNYCWVKNTYFLPLEEEIPKEHEEERRREILYYQWVPFIFLLMAFFFYIPCQVWRAFNSKAGVDADNILAAAANFMKTNKEEKREKTLKLISNQMDRFLGHKQNKGLDGSCQNMMATICCFCGKRLGNYLIILYFFTKVLFVANVFGQLFVLSSVLKTPYNLYGVEAIQNVMEGQSWINETVFPRVTMCDFLIRRLGNVQRYTVQCLLPINLYTEKMFIMLWFWMVIVLFFSTVSLFMWVLRSLCNNDRVRFIKTRLMDTDRLNDDADYSMCDDFVMDYLKQDGVFLLRLIGHNTNAIVANDIVAALWDHWIMNYVPPSPLDKPKQNGTRPKPTAPPKPETLKLRKPNGLPNCDDEKSEAPPIYTPTTEKDV